MLMRAGAVLVCAALAAAGQERPISFCCNGGYERLGAWNASPGDLVAEGRPGRCVRIAGRGSVRQDVAIPRGANTMTAAVDVRAEAVRPVQDKRGYGYAAVYQLGSRGELVEFRDFVLPVGDAPWRRHSYTFRVHPRARSLSLRAGLFQATGTVWFDNWTLVHGSTARTLDQVQEASARQRRPGPGRVGILREPAMPTGPGAARPGTLAAILHAAGIETCMMSAEDLADPAKLNVSQIDLVVIPSSPCFPAAARDAFVAYLRTGGDFISMGGYAFNRPVCPLAGRWVDEPVAVEQRLAAATSQANSLLPNGGFEAARAVPLRGMAPDGQWRRSSEGCRVVAESPTEGRACAKVVVSPDAPTQESRFWLDLPARQSVTYHVQGALRTRDVAGRGFAYMALYQHAADGHLVKHADFVQQRGTHEWGRHTFTFVPERDTKRLHIKCGLYLASGTAWFDDLRLADVTGIESPAMNTATGRPRDGLETAPAQIGAFDPSFPLERVRSLAAAPGQHIVPLDVERRGEVSGWAASGVRGHNSARWVPLIQSRDRYGRPRGAAAALMVHYAGFYDGSSWAYFGVNSVDLFADPTGPMAKALQATARFMLQRTYLHTLTTDQRLYRPGERARMAVRVANRGAKPARLSLRFRVAADPLSQSPADKTIDCPAIVLGPEQEQQVDAEFAVPAGPASLYRVAAELSLDGRVVDEVATGFVVEQPRVLAAAADSLFRGNYFTRGGRAVFLFGSDTYSYTYSSRYENPLTWAQDHRAARDIGLNVYENLQYSKPGHKMAAEDWRAFRAMAQLTQEHNLVFMPGMLIGHNVAIGDAALAEQSAQCSDYAQHLSDTPALHYYINGDYRLRAAEFPDAVRGLWNRWLSERYGNQKALAAAWRSDAPAQPLGQVPFPPPRSERWDHVPTIDRFRFECWLTRRWNRGHVAAVRQSDGRHPIMSEYYSKPYGGLDQVMTIDGQDVADFGFFDRPVADIDALPLRIRWNDLRVRGKGVTMGEYGVKTHPAWTVENGGGGYHIARTVQEQKQLFLAVAHYALGMGVSKIQNWCLRDAQTRVFPWGLFYPNQLIPKDVAYVHRNESVIWRHFTPVYRPAKVAVCLADNLRLGVRQQLGVDVAYRAFGDLLALHHDFNVIDDHHLDALRPSTVAVIYPSPFAVRDDAYARVLAWVRAGGALLVTGDISYDADRQLTRPARLRELAGVAPTQRCYPHVERGQGQDVAATLTLGGLGPAKLRPCIECRAAGAEVLGRGPGGMPVLTRHRVGKGVVYWCADPLELAADAESQAVRRALYRAFLRSAGCQPLTVQPDAPWLHVMAQATTHGRVHVVFNTRLEAGAQTVVVRTAAGPVSLATRNRWPALACVTDDGRVVAANAYGRASAAGEPIMAGAGLHALLSLDRADLRQSRALLVGPFEPGRLVLPPRSVELAACVGEFRGGRWTTLERVPLDSAAPTLGVDPDRATCMVLICEPKSEAKWTAALTEAMTRPERIRGY